MFLCIRNLPDFGPIHFQCKTPYCHQDFLHQKRYWQFSARTFSIQFTDKLRFTWTLKHNTMQCSAQSSFYKVWDHLQCSHLSQKNPAIWTQTPEKCEKTYIGFRFETLFVIFCSNGRLVMWRTGSMKMACNFIKKHEVVLVCGVWCVSKSPINLNIPGWICHISCHRSHFTPIKKKNIFRQRKQSFSKETKALLLFL